MDAAHSYDLLFDSDKMRDPPYVMTKNIPSQLKFDGGEIEAKATAAASES